MEQKLLVKVRNRQKIYIHNDLENAALYFKTKVEKRVAMVFRSGGPRFTPTQLRLPPGIKASGRVWIGWVTTRSVSDSVAQCLNLEREFHHTASKLRILGFEPLK